MAMTWPLALDYRVANDSVRNFSRLAIALMHEGRVGGRQAIPAEAIRVMHTRHAPVPGGDCGSSLWRHAWDEPSAAHWP